MQPASGGRGRGRGRPSLKAVNKEDMVGVMVELLIAKAWVKALVTGYYRKDNFYQLNFMENLPESGENKVMGEFCSVTWFKIDGGSKVEWRRAGRDLVTSRDVRSYLHSEVEYKGTERDLKLLGKAVKADWGTDGLFVGVLVNMERIETPQSDGKLTSSQLWKVVYADEDHESGEFMFDGKCLRLDDGVRRKISWFEDDSIEKEREFLNTYDGRLGLLSRAENPSRPHSVAPTSATGRTVPTVASPQQAALNRPLMRPPPGKFDAQAAPMQSRKLMTGKKFSPGTNQQKGLKRGTLGGEFPPTKTKTAPSLKTKPTVLNNDGYGPKSSPNGVGNMSLQKRGSIRSTDPSKELAREKTDAPKVEISKKDESAADLVFSSDSESPKGNSKKRGRLRKLNDIRSVGSKGQRLLAGERKNLGRSPAEDSDQEYMETPARGRGAGRRGRRRGEGRGRGLGRGREGTMRKVKSLGSEPTNGSERKLAQDAEGKVVTPAVAKSASLTKINSPTVIKRAFGSSVRKEGPSKPQQNICGTISSEVKKPMNDFRTPEKQDGSQREKNLETLSTSDGQKKNISKSATLVQEPKLHSASVVTPSFPQAGQPVHISQSARPPVTTAPKEKKLECISDMKRLTSDSLTRTGSSGVHRRRTVEDFKASLMRTDSRPDKSRATPTTVVGGMSDDDISRELAFNEFEQGVEALNMLCRPSKEKITQCTNLAIEGAKYGAARKIVQSMVETMQKEKKVERRINILYLIDSILRRCEGNERASKDYPTLVSAALNGIIEMLSSDVKAYSKLKQVLKIWEEDKKMPEKVMMMAKEKLELVKMQFGEEAELMDLRCKGAHIVHVPYNGPKCVPVALNNLYGSLGNDDPVKNQLGMNNIKLNFEPSRKKWDDIDRELAELAKRLPVPVADKSRSEPVVSPVSLTNSGGGAMQIPSATQDSLGGGSAPNVEPRPEFDGFKTSTVSPAAVSPDPFEQCQTMRVEIPSEAQKGRDIRKSISLPTVERCPDSCLQRWMEQKNEREFHQYLAPSGNTQEDISGRSGASRPINVNFQSSSDRVAAALTQDEGGRQTRPPLPPGPPPDDAQGVWPPLPTSPRHSFPDEAPLPDEPYPGDPPLREQVAQDFSGIVDDQMGRWNSGREQIQVYPPQPPPPQYGVQHSHHPAGAYSPMNQACPQPYRGMPPHLGVAPGYGPVAPGPPPRSAGQGQEVSHSRPYPRSHFSMSHPGRYSYPGAK